MGHEAPDYIGPLAGMALSMAGAALQYRLWTGAPAVGGGIAPGKNSMLKWIILIAVVGFAQAEVWVILIVNQSVGVGWTIGLMVLGVIIGLIALRLQGVYTLLRIHKHLVAEQLPIRPLIDLILILAGSALIILPGFIGDVMGMVVLLPPPRWVLGRVIYRLFGNYLPPIESSPSSISRF